MAKKKKQAKGAARTPRNGPSKQAAAPTGRLAVHNPLYERLLFALALLGVLVTVHLNVWYGSASAVDDPVCGIGFNCEAVLASDPMPLGVPSAVWGLLFYLAVAGVCAGIVFLDEAKGPLLKKIRLGMIGFGFLYSLFLTIYQFFVLSDRCLLCLISASIVTLMAVVLALYLFKPAAASVRSARPVGAQEVKLYGILTGLFIVLAVADYGYFSSQAPEATAATEAGAIPVAEDRPVDVSQCRYDPERPYYSNINQLITEVDPIEGNPDAPITIIEFLDPNCPHCKTTHPIMKAVSAKYPEQVRIVYKPVAIVGNATHSLEEAAALLLAEEQGKFSEMLEFQFVNQKPSTGLSISELTDFAEKNGIEASIFREQLTNGRFNQQLRRTRQVFDDLGLRGVPAVILEGRVVHPNSRSVGCMSHFIEQHLAAKGLLEAPETPVEETTTSGEAPAQEG